MLDVHSSLNNVIFKLDCKEVVDDVQIAKPNRLEYDLILDNCELFYHITTTLRLFIPDTMTSIIILNVFVNLLKII